MRVAVTGGTGLVGRFIVNGLLRDGHEVTTASDGMSGLAVVESERPDLVILDWMMPRMNGLEVCQAVRANGDLDATRVMMLTAKAQEQDVVRAFASGADDYLSKPFSPAELVVRVTALLARSR